MKDQKPLTSGGGHGPGGPTHDNGAHRETEHRSSGLAEQVPLRPKPMMQQNDMQARKRSGRLGRDVQSKLGKTLQAYFDDVVKEGVPDRFKDLLQQFEDSKDKGSS